MLSEPFLDESTDESGLGRGVLAAAETPRAGFASVLRPQVDHLVVTCKSGVSVSVPRGAERIVLARSPARDVTNQAVRSAATGEKKAHPNGSRKLGSLVPFAPSDDKPPLPPAPSSSVASGGSGGMQGKSVYGVVTARVNLIPPRDGLIVTLVEKRRAALRLFFILERPG